MFKIPEKITMLEISLFIILLIKLVFLYALVRLRAAKARGLDKKTVDKFENLEGLTHKLFFISMSLLMIYLFRPHALFPKPILIDGETKTFLFIFALLTLIGINYKDAQEEVKHLKKYYTMGF